MPVSCVSIYGKNSDGSMPRLHHYMLLMSSFTYDDTEKWHCLNHNVLYFPCMQTSVCLSACLYTQSNVRTTFDIILGSSNIVEGSCKEKCKESVSCNSSLSNYLLYLLILWRIILGGAKSELIETGLHSSMLIHPCMWGSSLHVYNSVDTESMQCAQLHWIGRIAI